VLYLGLLFTDRANTSRNLKITGEALRKYVGSSEPKIDKKLKP